MSNRLAPEAPSLIRLVGLANVVDIRDWFLWRSAWLVPFFIYWSDGRRLSAVTGSCHVTDADIFNCHDAVSSHFALNDCRKHDSVLVRLRQLHTDTTPHWLPKAKDESLMDAFHQLFVVQRLSKRVSGQCQEYVAVFGGIFTWQLIPLGKQA